MRGGQQEQKESECQPSNHWVFGNQRRHNRGHQQNCDDLDAANVKVIGIVTNQHPHPVKEIWAIANARRELRKALVDEVIADVAPAQVDARIRDGVLLCLLREGERGCSCLRFCAIGVACDLGDALAVHFARLEIHLGIALRRIQAQGRIEDDQRLEQRNPVGISDSTQSFDTRGKELARIEISALRVAQDRGGMRKNLFIQLELEERGHRP